MKHVTLLAIESALASSITIPLEMIHAADVIKRGGFVASTNYRMPVSMGNL